MPHRQIVRNINSGKLDSIYVLHGEEPFFISEIVQSLLDTVVEEGFKDFNETVLYGRDTNVDDVLAAARRFPMMADRQLVLVKEAQDMRMWKRKEDMAKLAAYAEDPVPTTVLVFAHPHKKIDSRLKAVKTMSRQGTLFLSDKIRDHKLPQWIVGYADSRGLKVDGRVSQLLAESLGTNLQKVANELSKLHILLPEGTQVTAEHVEQHIGISKDYNVFELQRALGNKDIERANRIVQYFEANPKNAPLAMVVPVLHAYFARVLVYQTLQDRSEAAAAKAMRCSPYAVRDYARAAGTFSPAKVERIFGYLRDADKKAKGRSNATTSDGMLLREAVFKILH
ncbi:MAG TPA: DNA polymerase III subunit delta [Flavobacteriales bacterium]|nr:DNA polymerase III subunit delta [Flavobacteriales bacterium]|tara:strand:+ start:1929 stop:2945 length:1017 start_codon:yes stop_codon:yes gene_type:complete